MTKNKKACQNCVLHTNVPGITINDDGLCSICENHKKFSPHEPRTKKYLAEEMENLFKKAKSQDRPYHVGVLFSGGKDSTILLKMAKEKYGLRPLAFSVIHPLVNDTAKKNMEEVTNKLNIDLIKVYPGEDVYKKAVRLGIMKGPEYGLDEFFGCEICSFFHFWIPIKYAMKMDIPVILEGSDLSQTGVFTYWSGESVRENARKGKKPFSTVHDLVMDAIGKEYKGSIYDYNEAEIAGGKYPTVISPFSFMDYDYRDNFKEIEGLGFKKKNFRTIYTNCSATPFFSYFSLKRFDCVSYIKHYATEVRRGYPNLMQHSVKDIDTANVLNKEVLEQLMAEYQNVVLYIAGNKLSESNITESIREKLKSMAPNYINIFGEEVCDVFLHDVLKIPFYADYFGVNLDSI
jgi:hypothetical protein